MAKKGLEEIWDRLAKKLFVYGMSHHLFRTRLVFLNIGVVGEVKDLAPSKAKDGEPFKQIPRCDDKEYK